MSCGLLPDQPPLVFRLNENGVGPELLRQVFLERGWLEFEEEAQYDYDWNLWWRTSRFRTSDYDMVYPWQRLNHYPKSTFITKKDALARNLKRMQCVHGANVFNFSPLSFNLPNDYTKYVKVYGALRQKSEGKTPLWICKPADLSRGRGIFIFRDLSELMYDCNAVVQHYIENPLLIGGYKFDLRIYVAVTSFHPLRVYIHEEGIARFSTEKFDLNSTKNIYAHLTNTSINKHSPGYTTDKERVGSGCKWTLTQLRHYFLSNNIDDQMLWRRIVNIVILTLLVQAPQVQKVDNCFELYGFDVLIDENIKPWLLEVNFSPSLGSDCQADVIAKKPMLHDLLDLLHFKHKDAERGGDDFRHYYKTFSGRVAYRLRGSLPQTGASHSKRGSKPGAQGAKQSRQDVQSTRSDSSAQAADVSFGLPLAGPVSVPQEDSLGNEDGSGESPGRKIQLGEGDRKESSDPALTAVVPETERNFVEEAFNSSLLVDSDGHSFPLSDLNKEHSKTTISADSHNSGGSGDSKISKISIDSGIASISKSARSSAKCHRSSVFGSLPEVLSRSRHGSGIHGRDSWCKDDASLHFPSLENSASSKKSKKSQKTVLTPRSTANSTSGEYPDQPEGSSLECENVSQTRSRSVSRKSLLGISNGRTSQRRHQSEDRYPMTHRSFASVSTSSVQPGEMRSSRQPVPPRNQSSVSYDPHIPAKSRFMQPHPRQQKFHQQKTPQHSSFASLKKRVGSFYLVFPFNEATHKVSLSTLDAKVVIRETQRFLREALNPTVSHMRPGTDYSSFDGTVCKEREGLWAPLRVAKDDA